MALGTTIPSDWQVIGVERNVLRSFDTSERAELRLLPDQSDLSLLKVHSAHHKYLQSQVLLLEQRLHWLPAGSSNN